MEGEFEGSETLKKQSTFHLLSSESTQGDCWIIPHPELGIQPLAASLLSGYVIVTMAVEGIVYNVAYYALNPL
jgi:hypothetical protein